MKAKLCLTIKNHRFLTILSIVAISALLVMMGQSAFAQPEQNDEIAETTGVEFQPRLGEYHYDITWGENPVGTGIISIDQEGDSYVLKARSKTVGLIDKIYRLRYLGETRISEANLSPISATVVEENKKRKKVQEIQYPEPAESGPVKMTETRYPGKKEGSITSQVYEFLSDTGVIDIYSAIFLARSFDWEKDERQEFSVIIGSKQYKVTLNCLGMTDLKVGKETVPVWVIRPLIEKIPKDSKPSPKRDMDVYLSADESRDLIRIKVKLGFGSVKLHLVKYLENTNNKSG